MLRRIKKDVENELTDKVEVLLYCPLTIRQKLLYSGLKRKIRIEDLLQNLGSGHGHRSNSETSSLASSLMNLVMQFRKASISMVFIVLSALMPATSFPARLRFRKWTKESG